MADRSKPQQAVAAEPFVEIETKLDGERVTQRVHPRAFEKVWSHKGWALVGAEKPADASTPPADESSPPSAGESSAPRRPRPAPTATSEEN